MFFFTADTHFGHANIIRFCDRPFSTVEEMDETIIKRWNDKVNESDTVFILGDMFFRSTNVECVLLRLKGRKRLIIGNHDNTWMKKVDLALYFESVDPMVEISDGQHTFTLCHYPMLSWNHQSRAFMIHGHIHNNTSMDYWPSILARDRLLNAGCDINGFEPVTFEELVEHNIIFKKEHTTANEE